MIISLAFIAALTIAGMSLTYLVSRDRPLMWRLAAGNIVGSAAFGLIAFVAACTVGFNAITIVASLVVTLLATLVFLDPHLRGRLINEWNKAKGQLQGVGAKRLRGFAYYLFFFLLFWFFFDKAMYELKDGLYTGGSNNLGDLPFHLGAILGFTEGNNFPPQNPSWAGARFSYPFIADFLTACIVKLGADVKSAIFLQDLSWAMSLLIVLERFARRLTGSKLAGRIAPALLFFTGGLGFVWFLKDWWTGAAGMWQIPHDYTINNDFRWGNSMVVLFITQRSLLLGMPLTLLVVEWLWKVFAGESRENVEDKKEITARPWWLTPILVGLLAGTLPLIHLHSLAVLFIATAFLLAMRPGRWKEFVLFGVGVALIAVPELLWTMTGSATESKTFFGFNWGWDKGADDYFLWFWLKNTGIAIPMIVLGAYLWYFPQRDAKKEGGTLGKKDLLRFYLPFAFIFLLCNVVKLAPWAWDNIKLLIYWFAMSTPLMAYAVVWMWGRKEYAVRLAAIGAFIALIFAGALDVFRTASGQIKIRVFDRDAMNVAEQLKQKTDAKAIFLNAPTYNSAVVLSGRLSVMRYSGHLASHGIDYGPREDDVKRIYQGGGVADVLLRKYDVGYVLIAPDETNTLHANEEYFRKYPVIAESGPYRVYKVK
jgi:hypothetical protein